MKTYRDFRIDYDPKPIPDRRFDWQAVHKDYDGAPDAHDNRYFYAETEKELLVQLDDWYGASDET